MRGAAVPRRRALLLVVVGLLCVALGASLVVWVMLFRPDEQGAAQGDGSGRHWPDAASTGPRPGVQLRKHDGDLLLDQPGQTVSGLDVRGCVRVTAPDVSLIDSRVVGQCPVVVQTAVAGFVIKYVEIDGAGSSDSIGLGFGGFNATGLNIHGVGDGVRANGQAELRESWVHDLATASGSHNDGVQITVGSGIHIEGNRIENPWPQTSAILIGADQGDVSDVVVRANLLAGGSYTLYGGARPPDGRSIAGIVLVDNVFSRRFYPNGGSVGPVTAVDQPGIEFSGNTWDGGGVILDPAASAPIG